MMVPPAIIDEEGLALHPQLASHPESLNDDFEHHAERRSGEQSVDRGRKRTVGGVKLLLQRLLVDVRLFGNGGEALVQYVGVLLVQNAAQGGILYLQRIALRAQITAEFESL